MSSTTETNVSCTSSILVVAMELMVALSLEFLWRSTFFEYFLEFFLAIATVLWLTWIYVWPIQVELLNWQPSDLMLQTYLCTGYKLDLCFLQIYFKLYFCLFFSNVIFCTIQINMNIICAVKTLCVLLCKNDLFYNSGFSDCFFSWSTLLTLACFIMLSLIHIL